MPRDIGVDSALIPMGCKLVWCDDDAANGFDMIGSLDEADDVPPLVVGCFVVEDVDSVGSGGFEGLTCFIPSTCTVTFETGATGRRFNRPLHIIAVGALTGAEGATVGLP